MKYNEAIDMILDGGKCRCNSWSNERYWMHFDDDGYLSTRLGGTVFIKKADINKTDWIVEKDGIVYEEFPTGKVSIVKYRVPKEFAEEITKRRLEDKIIADKVNEDWLEKKMFCFVRKNLRASEYGGRLDYVVFQDCNNKSCPFCFPEEKLTDELANSWELRPEDKGADFEMQKVKCEKVTVEDICFSFELRQTLISQSNSPLLNQMQREFAYNDVKKHEKILKQKLEYLVSLQGE